MSRGSTLIFVLTVSFFGLLLIAIITLNPSVSQENLVWRKPIVGSMFASVCMLGILAVFFPSQCSRTFNFRQREKRSSMFYGFKHEKTVSENDFSALRGHHPACESFSSHVFHWGNKIFCATCSGLFLGALIVLVGIFSYFFGNWQMKQNASFLVWVGILGVNIGLLQPLLLAVRRSSIRVFSSGSLAIGTFLILVGIDELAQNLLLDVFVVFLTLFWLMMRISISQWEHEKICSVCSQTSCGVAERIEK